MVKELQKSQNALAQIERETAWKEMAKQVAHEIKNPLTPMRLSLQHLEYAMMRKDDNLQEKITKTIKLLIRQIDSLSSMAEEFSSFAKMPEPKMEHINFKEVLQDAVLLMEREMGYTIALSMPDQNIIMLADPHQLGRIFNNLFKNALQAIPEGKKPEVSVLVTLKSQRVYMEVADNGKGIPEELHDKIFSPNFSTKNSGMGLGLAISKKIVEQFGGKISFVSLVDKGTTFSLSFPVL
jgi:nitrogen fixation/metabolism regulation signal transduction histidine kinase